MKKSIRIVLSIMVLCVFVSGFPVYAASQTVSVKIAEFPVTLNGVQVGNDYFNWLTEEKGLSGHYAQYPLLVYKDITYFPMTWSYSELLNLNTSWTQEKGLVIGQGDSDKWKGFNYDTRNEKNRINQSASIVNSPVTVNGKSIDNSKEPYPLLFFRDITYFPLTWRFAVDEFGWKYSYTAKDGLQIDANNAFVYHEPTPEPAWIGANVIYHVYIKDDLKVWQEFPGRSKGMGDMFISKGSKVEQVGHNGLDKFGLFDPPEDYGYFRVQNGWVYTIYSDLREGSLSSGTPSTLLPVRVNIQTMQFENLK